MAQRDSMFAIKYKLEWDEIKPSGEIIKSDSTTGFKFVVAKDFFDSINKIKKHVATQCLVNNTMKVYNKMNLRCTQFEDIILR